MTRPASMSRNPPRTDKKPSLSPSRSAIHTAGPTTTAARHITVWAYHYEIFNSSRPRLFRERQLGEVMHVENSNSTPIKQA
jgi:hypothetical protein